MLPNGIFKFSAYGNLLVFLPHNKTNVITIIFKQKTVRLTNKSAVG